jgi:rod shape-determining protein MreD
MRINGRFIIKSLIYALIFIFCTVMETNILHGLKIFGAKPNLIISLVVAAAVFETEKYAAALGMIFGLLIDSSYESPFLFSGLYYLFAAYLSSIIARLYFAKSLFTMIIIILPVCAVREIFNMFFLIGTWRDFNIITAFKDYAAPEYIYTVILAPAVYFLVKFTAGRINYNTV